MTLFIRGLLFLICGFAMVGALVFLPAGTLAYPNGWLMLGALFIPMTVMGIVLFLKSPALLQKRLSHKEKQGEQKAVISLSALMFLGSFVVSGLDFRFGWSVMPRAVTVVASVLFLLSYLLYAEVMRENAYLSRTIKVEEGQTVVSTGLYGIVRHPMYMATLLLFLVMPLVLGSWWALIPFAFYPAIIISRLKDEETLLTRELAGYAEYKEKVRYRIIPFIW